MIELPFNPDSLRDTPLARYLQGHPGRTKVLQTICHLLDEDGRVGDKARSFIVRSYFRRDVLRGTLKCLGIPIPTWARTNKAAAAANRQFLLAYHQA